MSSKAEHSQGLLLFRLHNNQQFALGTLKIRELVPYRPVTPMMNTQPGVMGAVTIREQTIPIVDMAAAIIAALPTLLVYVVAGKYFVRGLTAGAVKG